MKITLSWLKDHLETSASVAEEITEKLALIGLDVEGVDDPAAKLGAFTIARVIEAKRHPNADKLHVCKVDTGSGTVEVVCGAPNAKTGMIGVFAPTGSYIPGTKITLEARPVRGVVSQGMLVSERELELSDDHEGIIELDPALASKVGQRYADVVGLADPVIDVKLTPNRPEAGIIKPGIPVVDSPQVEEARVVLERVAEELTAPLTIVGRECFTPGRHSMNGQTLSIFKKIDTGDQRQGSKNHKSVILRIPLLGQHQVVNAATAYAALKTSGLKVSDEAIARGIVRVKWPCRFEVVRHEPYRAVHFSVVVLPLFVRFLSISRRESREGLFATQGGESCLRLSLAGDGRGPFESNMVTTARPALIVEARHQLVQAVFAMGYNRRSVAHEKCVEVERQHGLEALLELDGIVDHLFRQEPAASGRIADHRVADDQQLALLPEQPDFARRLSRDTDHLQRADALADVEGVVDFGSLAARIVGVLRMNGRTRAEPRAEQVGGAGMVAVGQQNPRRSDAGDLIENGFARLDRVDAQIAFRVTHQIAVEVVAMALRSP